MNPIEFEIPIKVAHSLNSRGHWSGRAEAVRKERSGTALAWRRNGGQPIKPVLRVTLTRVGPRAMDGDNVQGCLKAVRDQIAHEMRIDDGSKLVEWAYIQEKGDYAVRVRIEAIAPVRLVPVE